MAAGLAVLGVILWRRHSATAAWDAELAKSTVELDWVDSELLPTLLKATTASEFSRIWADGRQRLVAADQQLFGLAQSAPGEDKSATVSRLRSAVSGLIAAVDKESGLSSSVPDELRAARAGVEAARTDFSSALREAKGGERTPSGSA